MTKNITAKFVARRELKSVLLREPTAADGPALHDLVAACAPLDTNSRYCNLLHCTHFAPTSVAASANDLLIGFISAYLLPNAPRTLFVWQVAVAPEARKLGLAQRMLREILGRPTCRDVEFLHTTVTPDNRASYALFAALARDVNAQLQEHVWFERERHFGGAHADEVLLEIGPIPQHQLRSATRA